MGANKPLSRTASADESSPARVATDAAHALFMESTTILWILYRHTLSRPARLVVPEHTRDAFFQAFCDLRTNSPKDRKWLKRHLTALKPRTPNGWLVGPLYRAFSLVGIPASAVGSRCPVMQLDDRPLSKRSDAQALSAALLFGASGLAGLLCGSAALLIVLIYSSLFVSAVAGVATGAFLTAVSVSALVAAGFAAIFAAGLAWGYTALEAGTRTIAWTKHHLGGRGSGSLLPPSPPDLPLPDASAAVLPQGISDDASTATAFPPAAVGGAKEPVLGTGIDSQLNGSRYQNGHVQHDFSSPAAQFDSVSSPSS